VEWKEDTKRTPEAESTSRKEERVAFILASPKGKTPTLVTWGNKKKKKRKGEEDGTALVQVNQGKEKPLGWLGTVGEKRSHSEPLSKKREREGYRTRSFLVKEGKL